MSKMSPHDKKNSPRCPRQISSMAASAAAKEAGVGQGQFCFTMQREKGRGQARLKKRDVCKAGDAIKAAALL